MRGHIDASFNGYRAGGEMRVSAATPAADFLDPNYDGSTLPDDAVSQSTYVASSNAILAVAAVFPGGLPRWVRYTQAADAAGGGKRVPRGPRGILVWTTVQPDSVGYYAALPLPAACGFTANEPGVMLAAGLFDTSPSPRYFAVRGDLTTLEVTDNALGGLSGNGTATCLFTFNNSNTKYPTHATELVVDLTLVANEDTIVTARVFHSTNGSTVARQRHAMKLGETLIWQVRIPIRIGPPDGTDLGDTVLSLSIPTGTGGTLTATGNIVGWRLP